MKRLSSLTCRRLCLVFAVVALCGLMLADGVAAEKATAGWPQFLGPNRTGISPETGLLDSWPEGGPKQVWRVPGGTGMSAVAVADGRAVTLVEREDMQTVLALDAKTGKTLWQTPISPAYRNSMGNGPRATPALVGNRAYIFTGEGILAALDVQDGAVVWKHDVVTELDGRAATYGMACSPLVIDDLVVITAGTPQCTVVAYDRNTGKLVWKSGEDPTGYSSPALLDLGGRKQLVVFTGSSAVGLVPETGEQLWRYAYKTDYDCNIATPIEHKGQVFLSAGENKGCALIALKPADKGFDVEEVWTSLGPKSVMRNEYQTCIQLDGYLYGMDNVGAAGPITHLKCIEPGTGKVVWQEERFGKGNLIAADGKLWITNLKGELVAVRATPKGYQEIGRSQILGRTRQAPSIADGLLYLRDDKEIVCLDIRK